MSTALTLMRSIDERYRAASGLEARCDYSIFYSQVLPSWLLLLGWNPAGDPATWSEDQLASRSFYENFEHEYVDCHYPIATAMRGFLRQALMLPNNEAIRKMPKANLIFRRSPDQDSLNISEGNALREAQPFVEEIIREVQPAVIVLEGTKTLRKFERLYCTDVKPCADGAPITTPNGNSRAGIYQLDQARPRCLDRDLLLVGIGHPSKYAARVEWSAVVARSKKALASCAI